MRLLLVRLTLLSLGVCAACDSRPLGGGGTGGSAAGAGRGAAGTGGGAAGTGGGDAGTGGGDAGTGGGDAGTGGGDAGTGGSAAGVGGIAGGQAGTAGNLAEYTWTRWQLPGSDPFQIAAHDDSLFYVTSDQFLRIGRLEVGTGEFTEWQTAYTSTSPGGIAVRDSDGSVFITGATLGEIGQFAPATQTFTRWQLPAGGFDGPGPWSLALDRGNGVFFTAIHTDVSYVGRLDTATGDLHAWTFPGAVAAGVAVAPDGTVVFTCWNDEVTYQIARLDPSTGVFTTWPLPGQPFLPVVVDPGGDVFFEQVSPRIGVARLTPSTGRVTAWPVAGLLQDSMVYLSGRVYFTRDGAWILTALDPSVEGTDSFITPVVSTPVMPRSFQLVPSRSALAGQRMRAIVSQSRVQSQTAGAFETWSSFTAPRMLAAIPGALYVNESAAAIGRLTR